MSKFWRAFWEGANPAYWLAMALYGLGHLLSLLILRWDCCVWLYPAYSQFMDWSLAVQLRFGLLGPWHE